MAKRKPPSKAEHQEFIRYIKKWALKRMKKQEKKLKYYAEIYFGEPIAIVYARTGVKVVHKDGTVSEIRRDSCVEETRPISE